VERWRALSAAAWPAAASKVTAALLACLKYAAQCPVSHSPVPVLENFVVLLKIYASYEFDTLLNSSQRARRYSRAPKIAMRVLAGVPIIQMPI
jgi:hypothetical protein